MSKWHFFWWSLALFLILFSRLSSQAAYIAPEHVIRVGVVDTGLNLADPRFRDFLCAEGHYNFADNTSDVTDFHGHGTHVTGLIKKYAGEQGGYCFIIEKYYSESAAGPVNLANEVSSIKRAIEYGAEIINLSSNGPDFSEAERDVIRDNPRVLFVVAAGNEHDNLDLLGHGSYPGGYGLRNEIMVGSLKVVNGCPIWRRLPSSNYGRVVRAWEPGEAVSTMPCALSTAGTCEGLMAGTSQATAVHTGRIIRRRLGFPQIDTSWCSK